MNILHIKELIEMAIEKEKKRRDFYGRVAGGFKEKELKGLFSRLRDWEEMHVKKFTEIRDAIKESIPLEIAGDEEQLYMRAVVDERLYQDVSPENFSKNIKTVKDALDTGIQFEKDAILFFIWLKPYIADFQKEVIDKLIDEEKQHIVYLARLRAKEAK